MKSKLKNETGLKGNRKRDGLNHYIENEIEIEIEIESENETGLKGNRKRDGLNHDL